MPLPAGGAKRFLEESDLTADERVMLASGRLETSARRNPQDRAETATSPHPLCKHRRMSSHDDPEARIRELESSLGAQSSELTQSSSEVGSGQYAGGYPAPPPYPERQSGYAAPPSPYTVPQPPYGGPRSPYTAPLPTMPMPSGGGAGRGWIVYGVVAAILVAIIGGTVVLFANVFSSVNSVIDTFGGSPTASSGGGGGPFGAPSSRSGGNRPPAPTIAPAPSVGPAGEQISVAGVRDNKTIACNDSVVNVSGVSNTVVITGQCRSLTVSGVENTVTVDAAATISASGVNNHVTYLSGTPQIDNSGDSNVVEHG